MKAISIVILCALMPCQARSQGHVLAGWGLGGDQYGYKIDKEILHGGQGSCSILRLRDAESFGTMTQAVAADSFRKKRVRWSGWVKTQNAGQAALWMRVDGAIKSTLAFDNMDDRGGIRDTKDWAPYSVVLDVPEEGSTIFLGFLLKGDGQAWGDDFSFEVVSRDSVKSTAMFEGSGTEIPLNMRPRFRAPEHPTNLACEPPQATFRRND